MSYTTDVICDVKSQRIALATGRPDKLYGVYFTNGQIHRFIGTFDNKGNADRVAQLLSKYAVEPEDGYTLAYNLRAGLI